MKNLDSHQRDRGRKVVDIVRAFLQSVQTFRQQYAKYQEGSLYFSGLAQLVDDRGQSILYSLKETCHALFRQNNSGVSEKEQIFDLIIGSLFHLAMKMREDLYQLEFYGPKYSELSAGGERSAEQKTLAHHFKGLISRAQTSLQEGMEEMALLFKEVLPRFQDLLGEYRDNGLLLRSILEEKDLLEEVLGRDSLEDLFQRLYESDRARPYRLAGESYFQSGFYGQAAEAFSRAVEKNPADPNLQFMNHLSQGMEQYYAFAPFLALKSFEKCLSLSGRENFPQNYRDMIDRICQKIQEELPGRRKSDQHENLADRAKALQKQLKKSTPG
jgi:tetratricopeptide (TPR) repeat protein